MSKINWKALIISLIIPLAVGILSAIATGSEMQTYDQIIQPPLAPPSWLFPIVWTILFILMGVSSYMIYQETESIKSPCMILYAAQLAVNFFWTILFFNYHAYLVSFIWIILLDILIAEMIICFSKINKTAAYLQIPYLLWVNFAAYLNITIYFLNQ